MVCNFCPSLRLLDDDTENAVDEVGVVNGGSPRSCRLSNDFCALTALNFGEERSPGTELPDSDIAEDGTELSCFRKALEGPERVSHGEASEVSEGVCKLPLVCLLDADGVRLLSPVSIVRLPVDSGFRLSLRAPPAMLGVMIGARLGVLSLSMSSVSHGVTAESCPPARIWSILVAMLGAFPLAVEGRLCLSCGS